MSFEVLESKEDMSSVEYNLKKFYGRSNIVMDNLATESKFV